MRKETKSSNQPKKKIWKNLLELGEQVEYSLRRKNSLRLTLCLGDRKLLRQFLLGHQLTHSEEHHHRGFFQEEVPRDNPVAQARFQHQKKRCRKTLPQESKFPSDNQNAQLDKPLTRFDPIQSLVEISLFSNLRYLQSGKHTNSREGHLEHHSGDGLPV